MLLPGRREQGEGHGNTSGRLGVLPIDFVANTGWNGCLEDWIIRRNPFKAGYTFTYAIDPFKLALSLPGQPQQWWVGTGEHDWAVAVGLAAAPLVMTRAVGGTSAGEDKFDVFKIQRAAGGYLSVSSGKAGQVGIYPSGTTFYEQQHGLVSKYNGKPLRMKPNGELWCEDDGQRLEVTFVPA